MTNILTPYKQPQYDSVSSLLRHTPVIPDPQYGHRLPFQYPSEIRTYKDESPEITVSPNYSQIKYDARKEQEERAKLRERNLSLGSYSLNASPIRASKSYVQQNDKPSISGIGTYSNNYSNKKDIKSFMSKVSAMATNMLKNPKFKIEDLNKNSAQQRGALASLWGDTEDVKEEKNKRMEDWRKVLAYQVQERHNQKQRELEAKKEEERKEEERYQRNLQDLNSKLAGDDIYQKDPESYKNSPEPGSPFEHKSSKSQDYNAAAFFNDKRSPFIKGTMPKKKFEPLPPISLNMELDRLKSDIYQSQKIFKEQMRGFNEDREKSNQDRLALQKNLVSMSHKGGLLQFQGESVDILDDYIQNSGLTKSLKNLQADNFRTKNNQSEPMKDATQVIPVSKLVANYRAKEPVIGTKEQLQELGRRESRAYRSQTRNAGMRLDEEENDNFGVPSSIIVDNYRQGRKKEVSFEGDSRTPKHKEVSFRDEYNEVEFMEEDMMMRNPKSIEKRRKLPLARSEVVMRELEVRLDKSRNPLFSQEEKDDASPALRARLMRLRRSQGAENDRLLVNQNSEFFDLNQIATMEHKMNPQHMVPDPATKKVGIERVETITLKVPSLEDKGDGKPGSKVGKVDQMKKIDEKKSIESTPTSILKKGVGKEKLVAVEEKKSKESGAIKRKR